jgi:hypothetical protein
MSYTAPVTKRPPLGIRFENDEQEALERAAALDDRPVSAMGRKIILDWLRANGFLAESPNSRPKAPCDL